MGKWDHQNTWPSRGTDATPTQHQCTGLRVNRTADDAAGLSISEALRGEISGFTQGLRNSEQAVNLVQTAEGTLSEVSNMLIRMRELAVQSASSTVNNSNRESINAEFNQLIGEIDRIARVTSYNDSSILSGYGNTVSQDPTVSTALVSPTTGVVGTLVSGGEPGSYVFADAAGDGLLTVGNGIATQTIDVCACSILTPQAPLWPPDPLWWPASIDSGSSSR